jgi:hypothetical protein
MRPTLELLSHLRHPNVARVIKLCGPPRFRQPPSLASSSIGSSIGSNNNISSTHGDSGSFEASVAASSFAAWSSNRGFDFTFAQELAGGVAINHKSPPKPKPPLSGSGPRHERQPPPHYVPPLELGLIDLAVELVEALVAMHTSPVGTVVHGDLKVNSRIEKSWEEG